HRPDGPIPGPARDAGRAAGPRPRRAGSPPQWSGTIIRRSSEEPRFMNSTLRHHLGLCLGILWLAVVPARAQKPDPLPEGETGIAAKYPGDAGIEKDPAVVFAHDFEADSQVNDLRRHWDVVFHDATIRITDVPENVHRGRKALELTFPRREG